MTMQQPEDYVSIIGTSYLHPIARLIEELESSHPHCPNEVQASSLENGYAAAIIMLTVLLIESVISRTQYIRNEQPPKRAVEFVKTIYPTSGLADHIEELFVVRDVIAHNHVWEAQFAWDDQAGLKLLAAELHSGGDAKFRRVLDASNRKTKLLGINLFPTRICRDDAATVLKVAVEFLLFLERENRRYCYLSPQQVKVGGDCLLFVDLIARL